MAAALTIQNLTKSYPNGTKALQGITFSIKAGEFVALLGPNGAGKTTTINIIAGLCNQTSGAVLLFGKDVVKEYQQARSYLGLVPQEFNFDIFETVYKVLFFNAGYFGVPRSQRAARIKKILQELGLWEKRNTTVRELSGGMKRKLLIARALIHQPQFIILDEPTAGVDVETRKTLWNYFRKLNQHGTTILLTTHYIEEAEELCERIAIINQGKIIALDTKERLLGLLERETIIINLKNTLAQIPAALQKYHPLLTERTLTLEFNPNQDDFSAILALLQRNKLQVLRIETSKTTLEEVFLHLTQP